MIHGGAGNDSLGGSYGSDYVYGDAGDDTIGGDTLDGEWAWGNDHLYGGDGNDTIEGGAYQDWLYGDAGNDVLRGDSLALEPGGPRQRSARRRRGQRPALRQWAATTRSTAGPATTR